MHRALLAAAIATAAVCISAGGSHAKTISIAGHKPTDVKKSCGGQYLGPSKANGSYGCVNADGHGIYCGGDTKAQKKTCSTFFLHGPDTRPLLGRLARRAPR